MKYLMIGFLATCSISFAKPQMTSNDVREHEAVLRASQEKVQMLLGEIRKLKSKTLKKSTYGKESYISSLSKIQGEKSRHDECDGDDDGDDDNTECVSYCERRYSSDGSCASYGPDFCGPGASCAINCERRYSSDGSCASYGPDICY